MEAHRRSMIYAGVVAATVANCAPFGDPKRKLVSPMDFVPESKPKRTSVTQTIDEQIAIMREIAERAASS